MLMEIQAKLHDGDAGDAEEIGENWKSQETLNNLDGFRACVRRVKVDVQSSS